MTHPTDTRLRQIVERIERLMEERRGITDDIRDVYAEAKAVGYDLPTLRAAIARRGMEPGDRAEADALLEAYEAAIGGVDRDIPDARPDIAALAQALLADQLEGLEDPAQAALLVGHVTYLLDVRAEIAQLRTQESERKKLAKGEGFEAKQLSLTVRWFEKCAKHGRDVMRAGEAIFHQYRGTVERAGPEGGPVTSDPALGALFNKPAPAKPRKSAQTAARLRADAEATRRALGDDFGMGE